MVVRVGWTPAPVGGRDEEEGTVILLVEDCLVMDGCTGPPVVFAVVCREIAGCASGGWPPTVTVTPWVLVRVAWLGGREDDMLAQEHKLTLAESDDQFESADSAT